MTVRRSLIALLALSVLLPASACGAGGSRLQASFSPDRLGAGTTITLAVRVGQPSGGASTLARVGLSLPAGVTAGFNALGIATCVPATLEQAGPDGCSPNSLLGRGSAVVSVPIGAEAVFERVSMSIFMAPASEGHTTMEFYARGTSPVISQLVFQGRLLGAGAPFGGEIDTTIPPIAGLPEAPAPSLVSMQVQIDPKDLRYYKRVHGILVAYAPAGFDVPTRCPKGGFPFAATFTFVNGRSETVESRAPCPAGHAR